MKKLSVFSAAIALLLTLFFSSCALMNRDEFAQRKYYNFPRTKHTVEAVKEEHASVKTKKEEPVISPVESEPVQENNGSISAGSENEPEEKPDPLVLADREASVHPDEPAKADAGHSAPVIYTDRESEPNEMSNGLPFFFLFLLAIFLPFMAIYLHDNGRTNQWFWITLILCILAVGALGVGTTGLIYAVGGLWFVAALIALFVIFDVI